MLTESIRSPRIANAARIIAFPRKRIAYTECLYAAVEQLGVTVVEGIWAGRWLKDNVAPGDLIHIHWPSFLYYDAHSRYRTSIGLARFAVFLRWLQHRGARVVWTAHNLYPHECGRALAHRIARHLVCGRAERIFAHGPTAARLVAREFGVPESKLSAVKHGHWIDFHRRIDTAAEARAQLRIDAHRYVYGFVGSCRRYKNLPALIDAFERLNDDSLLLIAGFFDTDEYRARIEQRLQRLPTHRWQLHVGMVPDDAMHRHILAADALVFPYTEILTSGSAMLGLSFGRPVVLPNAGGLCDMVSEAHGVLYDPHTPDDLLAAMQSVRQRRFSEDVIITHARSFDWMDAARALVDQLHSRELTSSRDVKNL